MKQHTVFFCLVLCFSMLLTISSSNDIKCCNLNTIRVVGSGTIKIDANIGIIYASINQDGKTVDEALGKTNTILTSIQAVLSKNSISNDDITTSYFSVYPKYDYSSGNGVIVGYTVYLSLTVTIRGIDRDNGRVATVIDGIAQAGVSSISGITYDNANPETGKNAARKAAFYDASCKAREYAQLAGRKLGKIVTVDETSQSYYPYRSQVGS